MTLFTEFKQKVLEVGFEYFGRYYSVYRGTCYSNEDPDGLGRIRVLCPQLYEDESPDKWAWPRGLPAGKGHGLFWVPQPGDPIWVSFEGGDPQYPLFEPGWWTRGAVPGAAGPGKPSHYVLRTPQGHQLHFDDEQGTVQVENKQGHRLTLTTEGIELAGPASRTVGAIMADTYHETSILTVGTPLGPSGPPINAPKFLALGKELAAFFK